MVRIVGFLFAGGDAFFGGMTLLAIGAIVAVWHNGRQIGTGFRLATIVAWVVISSSGTPLPLWYYCLGGILTLLMLFSRPLRAADGAPRRRIRLFASFLMFWCVAGAAWELTYRFPSRFDEVKRFSTLVVIGDSISAGMLGPAERTWPKQFRERYSGTVIDLSREGATARSAIQQAQSLDTNYPDLDAVVLVEIGGNDYFELIPPADFATDLDRLLTLLKGPNRQIMMLELPLPPFYNAYGRVQRELAAKHRIPMISKREFARAVFSSGATLDTVHLSEAGHGLMAEMIWRHVAIFLDRPMKTTGRDP